MVTKNRCSIALIRPSCTAGLDFLVSDEMDVSDKVYAQRIDFLIDYVRMLLGEAAENTETDTCVTEFQLFGRQLSRKRISLVAQNDLIVTLDPSPTELNYCFEFLDKHNALQRGVAAFTSLEKREEIFDLLAAKRIPVFTRRGDDVLCDKKIPRVFSIHAPLNEDDDSKVSERNRFVLEQALRFPNIPGLDILDRKNFFGIKILK